jgi:hypothetical protein
MSRYGVRVCGAANTLVAWLPGEPHGTSLQDCAPSDPNPSFFQKGLAFVMPSRIESVWKKFQLKEISRDEAIKTLYCPDDYSVDEIYHDEE